MIWQSIVWTILVARVPYALHDRLEAVRADVGALQERGTALYLLYRELPGSRTSQERQQ